MLKELENIFKALSDKNRLRIVNMLCQKPLCVCELTYILRLSQSTVSGHLKVLKDTDIVIAQKDKLWVEYILNQSNPWLNEILPIIKSQATQDSLMENDISIMERADRNQLCKK